MRRAERLHSIEGIGESGIPVDEAPDSLNRQLLGVPLGRELYKTHGALGQQVIAESTQSIFEEDEIDSLSCIFLGSDAD